MGNGRSYYFFISSLSKSRFHDSQSVLVFERARKRMRSIFKYLGQPQEVWDSCRLECQEF